MDSETDSSKYTSNKNIDELRQEIVVLKQIKDEYFTKIKLLENDINDAKKIISGLSHRHATLQQEIELMGGLKEFYKKNFESAKIQLEKFQEETNKKIQLEREIMQQKLLSESISESEHKSKLALSKKSYTAIASIAVIVAISFVVYSHYESQLFLETATNIFTNYNTGYLIQNLKGDTINTWVSWNIPSDRILHVDIVNQAGVGQDKIDAVKDAILSKNAVQVDNSLLHQGPKGTTSTYYTGWVGALSQPSMTKTQMYVPDQFEITQSTSGRGDIIIVLSPDTNPDGYTGFTKSVSDQHQILRSTITIFQVQDLSLDQLKAITRHEFGHAIGLAHATDPNDLMHATIQTQYPYISGCDILAINKLYNGSQSSQTICQ